MGDAPSSTSADPHSPPDLEPPALRVVWGTLAAQPAVLRLHRGSSPSPLLETLLLLYASPARGNRLLFAHFLSGHRVSFMIPVPTEARFSHAHELRLCPRYADSASLTVLDSVEMVAFVKGLGAEGPLDAITIVRGVVVQGVGVLEELAKSVLVHADPGPEQSREPFYAYAQMGLVPFVPK